MSDQRPRCWYPLQQPEGAGEVMYCGHPVEYHRNNSLGHTFVTAEKRAFDVTPDGNRIGRVMVPYTPKNHTKASDSNVPETPDVDNLKEWLTARLRIKMGGEAHSDYGRARSLAFREAIDVVDEVIEAWRHGNE